MITGKRRPLAKTRARTCRKASLGTLYVELTMRRLQRSRRGVTVDSTVGPMERTEGGIAEGVAREKDGKAAGGADGCNMRIELEAEEGVIAVGTAEGIKVGGVVGLRPKEYAGSSDIVVDCAGGAAVGPADGAHVAVAKGKIESLRVPGAK